MSRIEARPSPESRGSDVLVAIPQLYIERGESWQVRNLKPSLVEDVKLELFDSIRVVSFLHSHQICATIRDFSSSPESEIRKELRVRQPNLVVFAFINTQVAHNLNRFLDFLRILASECPTAKSVVIGEDPWAIRASLTRLGSVSLVVPDLESIGRVLRVREGRITLFSSDSLENHKADSTWGSPELLVFDSNEVTGQSFFPVEFSRGCPFSCTYCYTTEKRFRRKPFDTILHELRHLHMNYSMTEFLVLDENVALRADLLEDIEKASLSFGDVALNFKGYARVDCIDRQRAGLLQSSGFREVRLGIETGSDRLRRSVGKMFTNSEILECVKLLREHRVDPVLLFLVGLPGETANDIRETVELIRSLGAVSWDVHQFMAFPASIVYRQSLKRGLVREDDWLLQDFSCASTPVVTPKRLRAMVNA